MLGRGFLLSSGMLSCVWAFLVVKARRVQNPTRRRLWSPYIAAGLSSKPRQDLTEQWVSSSAQPPGHLSGGMYL